MWLFWNAPEFCSGDSKFSKTNPFFVLCNEELNYENYIEKCIGDKECSVSYTSHAEHYFQLSYQSETIFISLEARLFPKITARNNIRSVS
jgi:hypothetical protein